MHKYRTHNCSELNKSHVGQTVKLSGWVHSKRDHGSLIFIDLRDHFGITQIVIDRTNSNNKEFAWTEDEMSKIAAVKLESVVTVIGVVVERSVESTNKNISTGEGGALIINDEKYKKLILS